MTTVTAQERATSLQQGGDAGIAEVARGSTLNLAGAAIFAAATLGMTVLVTREFSRQAAGAFFTATSLFLILELATGLGAQNGVIYFIVTLRSRGSDSRIPALLRTAIVPVLITSVVAAGLLLAFAHPLARALLAGRQLGAASPHAVAEALRALAVALPFAALLDTLLGATRGYRHMRPTVAVDKIGRALLQLVGVLIAAVAGTAALLAPLWAAAYIPAAVAAWIWLRRIRRRRSRAEGAPPPEADQTTDGNAASFWRFTAPRALAMSAQVVIQRLDIVLVAIIRGPIVAAVYTAATRFLVVGQLGNAAINMAAQPQLSYLFAWRDSPGAKAVYQATTGWLILLTWPLYLLAINYGPALLTIFGHSYRAGSGVMVILSCAMLLASACGQVDVVLISTGRSALSLANGLVALAVNVGLDLLLIPRYGITGAAIGWAVAIAAANLIPLVQLARLVRVHPFGTGMFLACALTVGSFGLMPVLFGAAFGDGPVASVGAVAASCVALVAGSWRWREQLHLPTLPTPRWWSRLGWASGRVASWRAEDLTDAPGELFPTQPVAGERMHYLTRVSGLLWPRPARAAVTRHGRAWAPTQLPDGRPSPPPGSQVTELMFVPGRSEPRLLVPRSRRPAAAAIRSYGEPGSRSSRLRKRVMWFAMASNAGPALFPDRLVIEAPDSAPTIASYLACALGREIRMSMYVSSARANRKPVLQLFSPGGEAVAAAKIGIDALTRQLVRDEHKALEELARVQLRNLTIPRILEYGTWNGLEVLVLAPLPVWLRRRRLPSTELVSAMQEIAAIDQIGDEQLAVSAHSARLRDRVSHGPEGPVRAALESALDRLSELGESTVLSFGSWHGDWSPWNMASTEIGLLVWDWERFARRVPVGFDALHFWLQTELARRRPNPPAAARKLIEHAPELLRPFGVESREARFTALLYLAEVATRFLVDRQEEAYAPLGNPGWWLIPVIIGELER